MHYTEIKKQIEKNDFAFKKKFGQNFIIDENIIKCIIDKSKIDKDTLVIEIGPGAGSLTSFLVQNAGFVLCYEIDTTLTPILNENLKNKENYKIIYEDFLKADIVSELSKYDYKKIYVVANLPYYITTPIVVKLIEDKIDIDKIVIMVQKEVGNRFKAKPNSKDYSSLSIFINYYFDVQKIMDVSKNVFIPKPNVDSIVILMEKRKSKISVNNETLFFKLIRDSFKQKRKTLRNNLKDYDLQKIERILNNEGYSLSSRAEQIPMEVFIKIVNNYEN